MLTAVEGIYENGAIRLLEPLPGVSWARVVVTILPESVVTSDASGASAQAKAEGMPLEHDQEEEGFKPQTESGKRLWEIRQRAIAKGMRLLSWDEVNEEVRQRRGGAMDD